MLAASPSFAEVELTKAEKDFLASIGGKVTFCVDPDWEPFEVISPKGRHEGIAADLLRLATERVGLTLELVPTKNWDDSISASKSGQCTLLSFLNQTPKRDEWLIFTEPMFTDSNVFITREEHPFIVDPAMLEGETIALPSGTSIEERIRRDYPNLRPVITNSEAEAIDLVSSKKASMTMRSLIVAAYTIRKEGLFNLKISGQLPNYTNNLRVGVLRNQNVIRDILNKGINTITPTERGQIINRHVSIKVQTGIDYALTIKIGVSLTLILMAVAYWGWRMLKLSRELKYANCQLAAISNTDGLTGIANRRHFDDFFANEWRRAKRVGAKIGVAMIDVDWFKKYNDFYGHQAGDECLKAVAQILKSATHRVGDIAARYGGEEFTIICTATDTDCITNIAEMVHAEINRLQLAHEKSPFGHITISIGVASVVPHGDNTPQSLLLLADNSLYQAKELGRNRIIVGSV
jgi:diguanylate cyclase (GGDEF)-like protein